MATIVSPDAFLQPEVHRAKQSRTNNIRKRGVVSILSFMHLLNGGIAWAACPVLLNWIPYIWLTHFCSTSELHNLCGWFHSCLCFCAIFTPNLMKRGLTEVAVIRQRRVVFKLTVKTNHNKISSKCIVFVFYALNFKSLSSKWMCRGPQSLRTSEKKHARETVGTVISFPDTSAHWGYCSLIAFIKSEYWLQMYCQISIHRSVTCSYGNER